jgi:hypothetical protein
VFEGEKEILTINLSSFKEEKQTNFSTCEVADYLKGTNTPCNL